MSSTARQQSTDVPEAWYGEPQHEVRVDEGIEFERYGEPQHERPPEPIEFVSGIEYRPQGAWRDASSRTGSERSARVLRIGYN